ncbi:glycoprotein-N-acetylgalactosamine 3-beta-galactosyltransferase 1-like isoform X2 [Pomacea canaliculata]|nr:glycoprotein-N-acetylgalactosamine 3-beta-galactosyltransferase 1-like isoform X2 [Pomacea canaliculata]XP_025106929.1 glycoprotein-N-acetylgalactosamine 3-beta-galactosyltransferase 1-like isoform X2 [Pomacea canaliculata]XP_025106930.1 glycoprotein-N-acetylgalactosamine 3-beta-galactosyltransferase 1-like isoform X2 [Pomacea canaliculata]
MSNKGIVLLFMSISGMILLFVYSRDTVFLKRRECVPVRPTDGNQDQTLDFTPRPTVVNDQRSDETLSIRDGATVQLRKNARIMCWIPSVESQLLKKIKAVNDTWVRRCDGHVFFVNTSIQLPDVKNLNVPDGRQHLTAKSMQAFRVPLSPSPPGLRLVPERRRRRLHRLGEPEIADEPVRPCQARVPGAPV